jgi:hypothetical protein
VHRREWLEGFRTDFRQAVQRRTEYRTMTVSIDALPEPIAKACIDLREGLTSLLGPDLVSLWVYGAITFPDRPACLGDVDTHGVLASAPAPAIVEAIDQLHAGTAALSGIEWDSWYITEHDAAAVDPPLHAFRNNFPDRAWALHRAHWLAGQYVHLHGRPPEEIVRRPTWPHIRQALRSELDFIERQLADGPLDEPDCAFAVWNACRVIYSARTRDVVISKRAGASWALDVLPARFRSAIRAAERVYDGVSVVDDLETMRSAAAELLAEAWRAIP